MLFLGIGIIIGHSQILYVTDKRY